MNIIHKILPIIVSNVFLRAKFVIHPHIVHNAYQDIYYLIILVLLFVHQELLALIIRVHHAKISV